MFEQRIFPVLTPLAVDPATRSRTSPTSSLNLAVMVRDPRTGEPALRPGQGAAAAPALRGAARRRALRAARAGHRGPPATRCSRAWSIEEPRAFRVTRNADLTLEDEDADDLLAAVEIELRRRRFGRAVRLEVEHVDDRRDPRAARSASSSSEEDDVYRHRGPARPDRPVGASTRLDRPELKDTPWPPVTAGPAGQRRRRAGRHLLRLRERRRDGAPPLRELRHLGRGVHPPGRRSTRRC